MTTDSSALVLQDITLEYPDGADGVLTALDAVNLTAHRGEVLSLVGPSGSGKSSLLAVAAALIQPTSGTVKLDGVSVAQMSPARRAALRRDSLGIIFQQPNLLASLTAIEQLILVDDLRGASRREARKRAHEALELVGLEEAAGRRPHQLSGGQRQRVNIARALMGTPSVLLVDEPTAALDHDRSASIVRLLRQLTTELDVATLMVTHDTEFVPLTDAVASMRDGALSTPELTAVASETELMPAST